HARSSSSKTRPSSTACWRSAPRRPRSEPTGCSARPTTVSASSHEPARRHAVARAGLSPDEPPLADADLVTSYCQDPLFERYLTTPWPYSHDDAEAFLGVFVPESWASGAELTWAIRSTP